MPDCMVGGYGNVVCCRRRSEAWESYDDDRYEASASIF